MRPVGTGVQWTSRMTRRARAGRHRPAITVLLPSTLPAPAAAATDYIPMSRSDPLARPTSGIPWANMKAVADGSLGTPNLCNQDLTPPAHLGSRARLRADR